MVALHPTPPRLPPYYLATAWGSEKFNPPPHAFPPPPQDVQDGHQHAPREHGDREAVGGGRVEWWGQRRLIAFGPAFGVVDGGAVSGWWLVVSRCSLLWSSENRELGHEDVGLVTKKGRACHDGNGNIGVERRADRGRERQRYCCSSWWTGGAAPCAYCTPVNVATGFALWVTGTIPYIHASFSEFPSGRWMASQRKTLEKSFGREPAANVSGT